MKFLRCFAFITFLSMFTWPLASDVIAQSNQWTWVKGSNTIAQQSIYGTKGVADSSNTPGSRYNSVTWTDNSGNLWLFGGSGFGTGYAGSLNDLWKYDVSTGNWTWMKGSNYANDSGTYGTLGIASSNNTPGGREGSTGWTDNNGNFWLFGGYATPAGSAGFLNDLWKYDVSTGNWTWIKGNNTLNQPGVYGTLGMINSSNIPGGRRSGSKSWTDNSGNLWLFGGFGFGAVNSGYLNDLWKYDITSGNWTWIKGNSIQSQVGIYGTQGVPNSNNTPGARTGNASWRDNGGNFWILGGYGVSAGGGTEVLDDLWKYNVSTGNWTWIKGSFSSQSGSYGIIGVASAFNKPGSRQSSTTWTDSSNLWLFGGSGFGGTSDGILNDLWKYNISTGNWTWMKGSQYVNQPGTYGMIGTAAAPNVPGARGRSVSWIDKTGKFWLFGGFGNGDVPVGVGSLLNDLWKYEIGATPLPLTITDFTIVKYINQSLLNWTVSKEENITNYDIEHSTNGRSFTKVGSVASQGNTYTPHIYSFTDVQPLKGANYYRLKIKEKDGKFAYSEIRLLNFDAQIRIVVFPNPVKSKVTITGVESGMQIKILNTSGQTIMVQKATGNLVVFPMNLVPAGRYQIQVYGTDNKLLSTTAFLKE